MKLSKKQALEAIASAVRHRYQSDHHLERQVDRVRRILADAGFGQQNEEEAGDKESPRWRPAKPEPFQLSHEFPLAMPPERLWKAAELAELPDWTVLAPRTDTLLGDGLGLTAPSTADIQGRKGQLRVAILDGFAVRRGELSMTKLMTLGKVHELRDALDEAALKQWPVLPGLEGHRAEEDRHVVLWGDLSVDDHALVDVRRVNPVSHEEFWTTIGGRALDLPHLWAQAVGMTLVKVPREPFAKRAENRATWMVLNRVRESDGELLPLPPFAGVEEGAVIH